MTPKTKSFQNLDFLKNLNQFSFFCTYFLRSFYNTLIQNDKKDQKNLHTIHYNWLYGAHNN